MGVVGLVSVSPAKTLMGMSRMALASGPFHSSSVSHHCVWPHLWTFPWLPANRLRELSGPSWHSCFLFLLLPPSHFGFSHMFRLFATAEAATPGCHLSSPFKLCLSQGRYKESLTPDYQLTACPESTGDIAWLVIEGYHHVPAG